MTKTVVVPLDGSPEPERAAPIGAALAHRLGAELVLATVASIPDAARMDLERVATELGSESARIEVVEGHDVLESLAGVVAAADEPLLCMTTHARGRLGGAVLGSTAEGMLREAGCAVVLVGPHAAPEWPPGDARMIACVDESPTSDATLDAAARLAGELGLEVWLTEVFHPLDVESAEGHTQYLHQAATRLHDRVPDVRAIAAFNSYVPGELVRLAGTLSASMLALGTHGRSGLSRLTMGSVAMATVHRAPCPVLAVGPHRSDARREEATS